MSFERIEHDNDARYEETVGRRNGGVKRPKARRRASTVRSEKSPSAPGGIRQRRNKRWAW
jgi:hypothetical protein